MISKVLLGFSFLFTTHGFSQDSINIIKPKIDISGFIDTYYSYDFSTPKTATKLPFLYNYNRHNEFNVNIGLLRASVSYQNIYAKMSIHAGTYVDNNYAAEDLKILSEAYLGVFLNESKKTSLEAGILPSYIGFETATSHSNLTATRSILAENSPYFMTGIKLNHQFTDKVSGAFFMTNGWQRINKPNKNVSPSVGTQLVYKSSEKSTLNWSTFVGKEFNGTNFTMRYFNNIYWDKTWNDHWRTISGFDFGIQDISSNNDVHKNWLSPVIITQHTFSSKWQLAHRIEYYEDQNNVIISSAVPFETIGNSLNLDFLPNSKIKIKIRMEGKWYHASELIFDTKKDNVSLTTTMSFEF